jgi:hypothetical protein
MRAVDGDIIIIIVGAPDATIGDILACFSDIFVFLLLLFTEIIVLKPFYLQIIPMSASIEKLAIAF